MEGRRLVPGENAKIDHINDLVLAVKNGNTEERKEGMTALLELFDPLIHKICGRWSKYFQDEQHCLIGWSVIINEARYWMMDYTIRKYIIDGPATYNKFINDHLMQRIRYIYETELKYRSKHLFPDPDKHSGEDSDMADEVHFKYGTPRDFNGGADAQPDMTLVAAEGADSRRALSQFILSAIDNEQYFTRKEAEMFKMCVIDGKTHSQIGDHYGVSRTRISQIIGKVRKRIVEMALDQQSYWDTYEGE